MKKESFQIQQSSMLNDNKRLKKLSYGLLALVFVLAITNYRLISNEKVVITPCGNPENSMWVGVDSISPEYMRAIGRDIITLALNVSPETIQEQNSELLYYVTPQLRTYLVEGMKEATQKIIDTGITQTFYIDEMKVVLATQTLYITGYLKTYIGKQQTSNIQQVYKLKFKTGDMNVKISEFRQLDPELDKTEMKEVGI